MNDFWNNISRYPRFFITSFTGLISVLLTPLRNLLKIPNNINSSGPPDIVYCAAGKIVRRFATSQNSSVKICLVL